MIFAILFCAIIGLSAVSIYAMLGGLSWVFRGITFGAGGIGGSLIDGYSQMQTWLEAGYSGASTAGLVLLIGLCCFGVVMFINLVMSGFKTAVT